ncbi:lycopene cyclase domain-containing protein [Dyadobacter tibetensis]|uniref:lycopene cyclase domain-containing protein n=1 Tax=Dyadobacter tibetensis TaxID=1211851 RepID=UPI0035B69C0A
MGSNEILQRGLKCQSKMNLLYLWINILSISVPMLVSFHPKVKLYRKWTALWPAIMITLIPFVLWDIYFTHLGIWGFNPIYISGQYILGLPIEEVMFFVCIPYACLYTYYCFKIYLPPHFQIKHERRVTLIILIILAIGLVTNGEKYYTGWTFIGLAICLIYLQYYLKPSWLGLFYYSHMFLVLPFLIVNGVLTGTGIENEVVWYNNMENMGIRILTIPVEDVFYGMLMLLMNVAIFETLMARFKLPINYLQKGRP